MTKKRFWEIIAASREGYDPEEYEASRSAQLERLTGLLGGLPVDDLRAFVEAFEARMDEAYGPPKQGLWAVASDIGGGCSDDAFDDFRSWLVSMGRRAFEAAVRDPDSVYRLAERAGVGDDVSFELFQYVGQRLLREKTAEDDG